MNDPTVAVRRPTVSHGGSVIVSSGLLEVWCSECGEVTSLRSSEERNVLQQLAHRHAQEVHDGLVDAVGWAR